MARRPVAVVAALVLLVEAVGIVAVNGILATFVNRQRMSLDGLHPDAMAAGTWAMGGVFGLYLGACGVILLLTGLRDRAPGRIARILLISCAIVHGVLGAVTVGLVGWPAFAFMMVVLGRVLEVAPSARRAGLAASGACNRKAEDRPRTGRTWATPTTSRVCVPGVAGQAGLLKHALGLIVQVLLAYGRERGEEKEEGAENGVPAAA